MFNLRNNIFETNSSSIHTVSIESTSSMEQSYLPKTADNKTLVRLHEFGWEWSSYDDQESKLAYLILMIISTHRLQRVWCASHDKFLSCMDELRNNEEFCKLEEDISDYAGTEGIYIEESEGYIDHQSYEDFNSMQEFLDCFDVDSALDFVFNPGIVLSTGNDND